MAALPPVAPLNQMQVDVLRAFEGFGRLDAPVWFLGMEEAGDNPLLLHIRGTWKPVMDLADAHAGLNIHHHHAANAGDVVLQSTWRPMCALMVLGDMPHLYAPQLDNLAKFLQQRRDRRNTVASYQSAMLGKKTAEGQTFSCELLPIPKPAADLYSFGHLFPMWASHAAYVADVLPGRIALLSKRLNQHAPEVVVAYGKVFWAKYRELFPRTQFAIATVEQAAQLPSWFPGGIVPDEQPSKIMFGYFGSQTLVVLTIHLTRLNNYARLSELANLIAQHRHQLIACLAAISRYHLTAEYNVHGCRREDIRSK